MKKRLSHFAYNERSRSSWTLTIPHFTPLSPIRSTIKTVTYVPGTFVTLVSGPHKRGVKGDFAVQLICERASDFVGRLCLGMALAALSATGMGCMVGPDY